MTGISVCVSFDLLSMTEAMPWAATASMMFRRKEREATSEVCWSYSANVKRMA